MKIPILTTLTENELDTHINRLHIEKDEANKMVNFWTSRQKRLEKELVIFINLKYPKKVKE